MKSIIFVVVLLPFMWACSGGDTQMKEKGNGFVPSDSTLQQQTATKDQVEAVDESKNDASAARGVVQHITAAQFKSIVFDYETQKQWLFKGKRPCVVDFYADWCGPCKMLSPTMDQLAKEYAGKIDFYKINIDKEPDLAQAFQVSSIPALLFCPQKDQPQMSAGLMSKEDLQKVITGYLLK